MLDPLEALDHFPLAGPIQPVADPGLINHTWSVGSPPHAILQWVNPIFDPKIHLDIDAVTKRLATQGLGTPELVPISNGKLWLDDPETGFWRCQTYVPGRTLHCLTNSSMAQQSGALVGRFHAALADWSYDFQARQRNIHDTPARFAELREALDDVTTHPLLDDTHAVAEELLHCWEGWEGDLDLPLRSCHGDLKISNLRFDKQTDQARCLVDLDTLGPQRLSDEMGDAWRSWCNPRGEGDPETCHFDIDLFEASAAGWLTTAPEISTIERHNLVGGIERICLELSARFLADALRNSYFREDRQQFPQAGSHNLLRARSQLALARSVRQQRSRCEAFIATRMS